jgi:hypothetical protein
MNGRRSCNQNTPEKFDSPPRQQGRLFALASAAGSRGVNFIPAIRSGRY